MLSTLRTLKLERCLCWWPNEISTLTNRDPDGHQPLTSTFIWCRFRNVYDGGEWNACHLNIIIWSEGALANLYSITKCHRSLIHFVQVTNHVLWRNYVGVMARVGQQIQFPTGYHTSSSHTEHRGCPSRSDYSAICHRSYGRQFIPRVISRFGSCGCLALRNKTHSEHKGMLKLRRDR